MGRIIPTDELIFFRGVGIPPTSHWSVLARPHNAEIEYLNIVARKRRCWYPPQRSQSCFFCQRFYSKLLVHCCPEADCKDSTIYVTARIRYCLITGCESTTIILGGIWAATSFCVPTGGGIDRVAPPARLRSFHDLHNPQLWESLSSCGCALLQNGELYRYICLFATWFSMFSHCGLLLSPPFVTLNRGTG